MKPIDIVMPWVDGSDPAWQAEKMRFSGEKGDASLIRFRDWGLLPYWFRGIEKFAPWVRTIHFITWGHVPSWLNQHHPKLHIVRHEDYLPQAVLPVFNVNPLELNMHRIEGLSEQFVYFNDDTYLLQKTTPETFFRDGLPCDDAILSPVMPVWGEEISRIILNDMFVINKHFDKKTVLAQNRRKFLTPVYGAQLLRTLCLLPWRHLPGFFNDHLPQPFLKSTFDRVWEREEALLQQVTTHRFRDYHTDVNQWLMRYWQFCEGRFTPASPARGKTYNLGDEGILDVIRGQKVQMLCINDSVQVQDFDALQQALDQAFASVLPDRSEFEL